jgi:hypothetical protein
MEVREAEPLRRSAITWFADTALFGYLGLPRTLRS